MLAALDLDPVDDDMYIPVGDDAEGDGVVDVIVRRPHSAMFTRQALDGLLPLVKAKTIDSEEAIRRAARAYVDGFVRPDLIELAAGAHMAPASAELAAVVPAEWYSGNALLVGKSNARGQCLFSSVGILLFGSGACCIAAARALHFRAGGTVGSIRRLVRLSHCARYAG